MVDFDLCAVLQVESRFGLNVENIAVGGMDSAKMVLQILDITY